MLTPEAAEGITQITEALHDAGPMLDVLEPPVRVSWPPPGGQEPGGIGSAGATARKQAVLDRIGTRLGAPQLRLFEMPPDGGLGTFERIVDLRLDLAGKSLPAGRLDGGTLAEVDSIVDHVTARSFTRHRSPTDVIAADNARLRTYSAGHRANPAVIIATACGMPAILSEKWVRFLAATHFVMTWESRGLFGDVTNFDELGNDAPAHAADLFAVLDHYQVATAHVMGFCTGAVIALAAASTRPERLSSLSLWHGSYELGPGYPITSHAHHIRELMAIAAANRADAAMLHEVLCQAMLKGAPPDMSHLVLYPYTTPELLYRYCRVNGTIADTNVTGMLPAVTQPALIVTSQDDSTAHPEASRYVAANLANATLYVEPSGDHISLFKARPRLRHLATGFLSRQPGSPALDGDR
jgi:3-oxoadipate enol-lactonase